MHEKIKSWWSEDGKWFCLLVNDGVSQATVSLTPEEAFALARDADPEAYKKLQLVRRQRDTVTAALNRTMTAQPDDHTQVSRDPNPAPQAGCAKEGERKRTINALRAFSVRVRGIMNDYRELPPEEDESWESWFYAAFDLAGEKISEALTEAINEILSTSPPPSVAEREWQEEARPIVGRLKDGLSQALREWRMYAENAPDRDLEQDTDAEAVLYRNLSELLRPLRSSRADRQVK